MDEGASRTEPRGPHAATRTAPRITAPRILALSSRVARGRVGLSIIEPALQTLGCEALTLPTIQLASRPGLGRLTGTATPPDRLADMIDALAEDGALAGLDAVLTGYAPSAEHVAVLARAIDLARRDSPQVRVIVDPVLGDAGRVYLGAEAAAALRDRLAPLADILTPNAFEMEWLSGEADASNDLTALRRRAAAHPAPHVVVTSAPALLKGHLGTLLVAPGDAVMFEARAAPGAPNGTGDLFGGLLAAHLSKGLDLEAALTRAVGGVHGVTLRSHRAGASHLLVTEEAG
ncbi:MAG: PfkB family carbohydrate kinase, partial [Pseudomonadota bacterium]